MSPREEIQRANEQVLSAAANGDFEPFMNALDDSVKVFDQVEYLFDDKASFLEYLRSIVARSESTSYTFNQTSCRSVSDTTAVVNAHDRLFTVPKGGGLAKVQCGRATWVYVKKGPDWKIVSLQSDLFAEAGHSNRL